MAKHKTLYELWLNDDSQVSIKELRNELTSFRVYGSDYLIRPNRISVKPKKEFPCRYGERCRKNPAACAFHHPEVKDRHLAVRIFTSTQFVNHIKTLLPGIEFEQSPTNPEIFKAKVWMPWTQTLQEIVDEHERQANDRAWASGEWKLVPCNRKTEHDTVGCRFSHATDMN